MRLNLKILILTIAILAVSLLVSSVVNVVSFRANYTEALLNGSFGIGHSINNVLDEMLALGLPLDSLSGMDQRLAEVVAKIPHIAYAGIANLEGHALFHSDPALIGQHFDDDVMRASTATLEPIWQLYQRFDGKHYYDVSIPVFDLEQRHVGVIRLGFLTTVVDDKVNHAITHTVINVLVTFIIIALLLNLFLRRLISEPVEQLSAHAQRITDGHYDTRFTLDSGDELGRLSVSLNQMAASLQHHIAALEQSHQVLEHQVAERTRELAEANTNLQANNHSLTQAVERERALSEQARLSEQALRESEERFRRMFEDSGDALLLLDGKQFVECNQAALDMLGCTARQQIIGRHPADLSPALQQDQRDSRTRADAMINAALSQGSTRFEWLHRRVNGEVFPVEVLLTPIEYRGQRLLHTVWRDITERKQAEAQIHTLAFYDPLTGLANRRLFLDRLEQARISNQRKGDYGALMLLDLDHFKTLNDTQGHDIGDQLLVQVAARLKRCIRKRDTVARLGGDEFVVMLDDLGADQHAAAQSTKRVAEKIRTAIARAYPLPGQREGYHTSASLGLTLFNGEQESVEALLKHADLALYRAKESGRDAVRFFDPEMQARMDSRARLDKALHRAIRKREFELHYQPQVDTANQLQGVEALLRWNPPGEAPISPSVFLPVAEDNGLILPLGYQVLEDVCLRLGDWSDDPATRHLSLAANISSRQLHHPDFVDQVRHLLRESGTPPEQLVLEINETAVLGNFADARAKMRALCELGVTFSLDDFGTGYSSLSNLKQLPIAEVKIDRSFVRDIRSDPSDAAIIKAIIHMARSLDIRVIAEGVETQAQHDFLQEHGCGLFQGYLFGRPMPADELEKLLRHNVHTQAT